MKSLEERFLEGFDAGKEFSLTFLKNIEDHGSRIFNHVASFGSESLRHAHSGDKAVMISIYEIGGRYFSFGVEAEAFFDPGDDWDETIPYPRPVRYAQPIEVNRRKRIYKEEYFDYTIKEKRDQKAKTEKWLDDEREDGYLHFEGSKVPVPIFDENETIV